MSSINIQFLIISLIVCKSNCLLIWYAAYYYINILPSTTLYLILFSLPLSFLQNVLRTIDMWDFDVFSFGRLAEGRGTWEDSRKNVERERDE